MALAQVLRAETVPKHLVFFTFSFCLYHLIVSFCAMEPALTVVLVYDVMSPPVTGHAFIMNDFLR